MRWFGSKGRRGSDRRRIAALIREADAARDARDWGRAIAAYQAVIEASPGDAGMHVQLGHCNKEAGAFEAAVAAYRHAAALRPEDTEVRMHLGTLLRRIGRFDEAVVVLGEALAIDPGLRPARDLLLESGSRDLLPANDTGAARALADALASLDRATEALDRWERDAARPVRDYDAFRADYPVRPPPSASACRLVVRIDARHSIPAAVRTTVLSLLDQTMTDWQAEIVASADMAAHSVGSFAAQDERIRFVGDAPSPLEAGYVLLTDAGAMLDPNALAWFGHVAAAHAPALAYADHDAADMPAMAPTVRFGPRLYPMFDAAGMAAIDEPPLLLLVRADRLGDAVGSEADRRALLSGAGEEAVAHVPRVLASRAILPAAILGGADDLPQRPPAARPAAPIALGARGRISIVIPTRDLAPMLERAVASLLGTAARPGDVEILVLDNRSTDAATASLLAGWDGHANVRVMPFDEPFNWARANNLAFDRTDGDILVYANNDIEMLTAGWDDVLAAALALPSVGAAGARLLYAEGTIQHAGVLMGFGAGTPMHEGLRQPGDAPGPLGRWQTRRAAAAVTGAFLAARRSTVAAIGGFDERELPIGYSDLDFCLKVRASGGIVLYEPALTLLHHESVTRGHNDRRSRLAWDQGECRSFHARWGEEMLIDPGYNPQWCRSGTPFDGYREPSQRRILDHIARSARPQPWRTAAAAAVNDDRG